MDKKSLQRSLVLFALPAIVFATSVAIVLFSSSKTEPQNTVINEAAFRLTLPGSWTADDPREFVGF